jgi:S-methylmethionine-dependent homocysteine/selenocysteine methylase/SAM-dependent methyltransferase
MLTQPPASATVIRTGRGVQTASVAQHGTMCGMSLSARSETGAGPAYQAVLDMIGAQRCVVLDGGTATELPRPRGQGALDERLWGTRALIDEPDQVLEVHRRYVAAGCDVISTNTWGLPSALLDDGPRLWESTRPIHWMDIARQGVRLAREAAGSGAVAVAFSLNGDLDRPGGEETVELLARAFASEPPDLVLLETLSLVRPSLFSVVEGLLGTGLPVWLSFRRCRHGLCGVYGQHWGGPEGDAFGRAARRFEELGVAALLVNCIPPDHVDGMVSYLRDFTDMPLGVYPNLGYYTSAGWRFEEGVGGSEYADMALRWRAEGAQIIGGCCGVGPEHIAAASDRLSDTKPGHSRRGEPTRDGGAATLQDPPATPAPWVDRRRRMLYPLPFPQLVAHPGVPASIPGSHMTWRYLFEEGIGAHQRCLDIGSGTGLQTIQLALNGAAHVHALDVDDRAVANTLDNAFRNDVADRVTATTTDLYPWVPEERYEVIVACLPQIPRDPLTQLSSHRPVDYWGRGLVDQVIGKLPAALAPEGVAYLAQTSILSRQQTIELLAQGGLEARVVAWDVAELPATYEGHLEHVREVEELSDAHHLKVGEEQALVTYLLEIRRRSGEPTDGPPWRPPG